VTILPYDGSLAGDVAFGGLLQSADALAARFTAPGADDLERCTTLATDGETFGHHHRNGDATLADALSRVIRTKTRLSNAATVVASHDAQLDAELMSPSSWSCAHGIERWRNDCGCRLDSSAGTSQRWRRPLRETLERIANRCHDAFEREGLEIFASDPWSVRDEYGAVVSQEGAPLEEFVRARLATPADATALQRGRELLELERALMRTFTSCAWFFDDVARIEVRQVLRYAARALELSKLAARLEPELIKGLDSAVSNASGGGTGADLFVREALPHRDPMLRAGAGIALLLACVPEDGDPKHRLLGAFEGYRVSNRIPAQILDDNAFALHITHRRTGRTVQLTASISGSGPDAVVMIRNSADGAPAQEFVMRDLPEEAARTYLARHLSGNFALD
jgi:hypothetical protein